MIPQPKQLPAHMDKDQKTNPAEEKEEQEALAEIEKPGLWDLFLDEVRENFFDAREAFLNVRELIGHELLSDKFSRHRRGRMRNMQPGARRLKFLGQGVPHQSHVEAFSKGLANVEQSKSTGIRPIQSKEIVSRLRNVLIVGGMDFLGAALVQQLNAVELNEITITDSLSDEACRRLPTLKFREFLSPEEFQEMAASRFALTPNYSHIFYLDEWKTETMALTKALLVFAAEAGTRFITFSPASSMGAKQPCPIEERHRPQNFRPLTQAGVISCMFDRFALSKTHNKNHLSLKHYHLFGRGEKEDRGLGGLVTSCYNQIRSTGSITLPGALRPKAPEGQRKFDFCSVDDAARIALYLAQNHMTEGVYELGSGTSATPAAIAQAVIDASGGKGKIVWDDELEYTPPPPEPEYARLERIAETGWKAYPADIRASIGNYISNYLDKGGETGVPDETSSPAVSKKAPWPHATNPQKNKTADTIGD